MAEYIERKAFLEDIEKRYCLPCKENGKDYNGRLCRACWVDEMRGEIIGAPAADVAPVRHGRWVERQAPHAIGGVSAKCSACGKSVQYLGNPLNYCPNCGAKMDGCKEEGNA